MSSWGFFTDESKKIPQKWRLEWDSVRVNRARFVSVVVAIAGILFHAIHWFWVDPNLDLENSQWFLNYRFVSIVVFAGLGIFSQSTLLRDPRYSDLPIIASFTYASVMQAVSMNMFVGVPYFYMTIPTLVSGISLKWPFRKIGPYAVLVSALQIFIVEGREEEQALIYSLVVSTFVLLWIIAKPFALEVESFVRGKEREEALNQKADLERDFRERLQVFFPREVFKKFDSMIQEGVSPPEAIDKVIVLQEEFVCCLHSDIRGFTKSSKSGDYILKEAAPNIQHCVDFIESYRGIPSTKGGDAILAYFCGTPQDTIRNALFSGFGIMEASNAAKNSLTLTPRVTRFVSITYGECKVGNIGGTYGSFNISALGTAVNLSARMDELTKDKRILSAMDESGLLLSPDAYALVCKLSKDFDIKPISLAKLGIKIRTFSEIKTIYFFPCSQRNQDILVGLDLDRNLLSAA